VDRSSAVRRGKIRLQHELLNKAFEPFFRVDQGGWQSIPGAGLGLAIAKEIIERYGGTVTLENRHGGRLCQTVVFDAVLEKSKFELNQGFRAISPPLVGQP
jgi:signal transduction histidine kinase